ncbi:MAG: hypothetical protein IPP71_13855 [Bacteroidetes bacterium]|nr:hypothetical protein [Bacteroidota bacterium]
MNYLRGNVFYFCSVFCQSNFCFSQSHPDSIGYFKSYLTNTRDIVVEPLHWNKQDIANFTMVAGATAFLMIYDEKLTTLFVEIKTFP